MEILRAILALAQGRVTYTAELYTVNVPPQYLSFLASSRVCRSWYEIITGTAEFWSSICLPEIRSHSALQLVLKNSGDAPLRVVYDECRLWNSSHGSMEDVTRVQDVFRAALAESARIQDLYVTVSVGGMTKEVTQHRRTTTGLLRRSFSALKLYSIRFFMPPIVVDQYDPEYDGEVDFVL